VDTSSEAVPGRAPRPLRRERSLRARVAGAILDAAAGVIASEGPEASMATIAAAAGVARATLYRYFPTRGTLLAELHATAIADAGERLEAARLAQTDAISAIERSVRALVEAGDAFVLASRDTSARHSDEFNAQVCEPLRHVFARGQEAAEIVMGSSPRFLADALVGTVTGVIHHVGSLGRDELVAVTTRVFIHGILGNAVSASADS
jgi:AcrR family transcriptional regulator